MKKFVIAAIALFLGAMVFAQEQDGKKAPQTRFSKEDVEKFRQGARDRIQSEHIAYLTSELELTPEEAEKFWPVYNKAHQEQMRNNQDYRKALKDLKTAVKEGRSEAEIKAALETYNKAKNDQRNVLADYQKDFIKILGVVKTAKLYVAEDSFRTRQIHNLTGGKGQPGGQPQGGYGKGQAGFKSQNGKNEKGSGMRIGPGPGPNQGKGPALIVIDGKIYEGKMTDVDAGKMESVKIVTGKEAMDKYGEKAKNGVVEITTKK